MGAGGGSSGGSYTTKGRLPLTGKPNSSITRYDKNGNTSTRRFYDENGRAKKDVDYNNHGNPKRHPQVPHEHYWDWTNPDSPIRK